MNPGRIAERLSYILCCSDCRGSLLISDEEIVCNGCGRIFQINNGIPDLRTKEQLRLPRIYNDPDYKTFYERLASIREGFLQPGLISWGQNAGHRAVQSLMKNKKYDIMLDLGCGEGGHAPFLDSLDNVIGIDKDQDSLERLKNKIPSFFVVYADALNLPLREKSVDCIMSIYNLEHTVYLDLVLEEMCRVLSPDGDVFVSVPNEGGFMFNLGRNLTTARKFSTDSFNYRKAAQIEHVNCIWQIDMALKRYFKIRKKVKFPFLIPGYHFNLVTTYHCTER